MKPYNELIIDAARRASNYLDQVEQRPIRPQPEALLALSGLNIPLQSAPIPAEEVLAELDEAGSPATLLSTSPRFYGFVIGGNLPASLAANILAAAWDQNAGLRATSPVGATLEDVASGWLLQLLDLPESSGVGFVSGATMANFSCLAAARHAVLAAAGWDVESNGLFGAPPVNVVVGGEAHVSLFKALGLLGLGRERVKRVPVDEQGRVRLAALPVVSGPTIVCLQAGNVNTGAFDPVGEICARVRSPEVWVHVDGAFGLWAAASPAHRYLLAGHNQADSWATDAHKWLNVPYDSGLAFVRQAESLRAAMSVNAAYLVNSGEREPFDYTPEFSRRARGIEIWAALRSLGRQGLSEMVARCCHCASLLATGLSQAGYSILNKVELNQVLVSFGHPQITQEVIRRVQEEGSIWCGGTTWQGQTAMRISVSNWATDEEDVRRSLEVLIRVARTVNLAIP